MKKFTLDPNNPPKLTEEQEKALNKTEHTPCKDCPELDEEFFRRARKLRSRD